MRKRRKINYRIKRCIRWKKLNQEKLTIEANNLDEIYVELYSDGNIDISVEEKNKIFIEKLKDKLNFNYDKDEDLKFFKTKIDLSNISISGLPLEGILHNPSNKDKHIEVTFNISNKIIIYSLLIN